MVIWPLFGRWGRVDGSSQGARRSPANAPALEISPCSSDRAEGSSANSTSNISMLAWIKPNGLQDGSQGHAVKRRSVMRCGSVSPPVATTRARLDGRSFPSLECFGWRTACAMDTTLTILHLPSPSTCSGRDVGGCLTPATLRRCFRWRVVSRGFLQRQFVLACWYARRTAPSKPSKHSVQPCGPSTQTEPSQQPAGCHASEPPPHAANPPMPALACVCARSNHCAFSRRWSEQRPLPTACPLM
jgi:hypothetical protein